MKQLFVLIISLFISVLSFSQEKPEDQIRKYWFVMLMKGPYRTQDSVTAAKIQQGHMANMDRLYYEGKLKVAGPFGDGGNWQGIFIFDANADGCKTKEQMELILKTDPAIANGRLIYELKPWYTAPIGSFVPGIPEKKN
jgi:uncharacterized protein YciI